MKRIGVSVALSVMQELYDSDIAKEIHNAEFRRSSGIISLEENVAKTNEKLYALFVRKNNIDKILERIEK